MKNLLLFAVISFMAYNGFSQTIFKGLETGMDKKQIKSEFKANKAEYLNVDIGNGFNCYTLKSLMKYDNNGLVGVTFLPKFGNPLDIGYDSSKTYLKYTRSFLEDSGYSVYLEETWWNAPLNYAKSGSRFGLVMLSKDNAKMAELIPIVKENVFTKKTEYTVELIIWNAEHFNSEFNGIVQDRKKVITDSGF